MMACAFALVYVKGSGSAHALHAAGFCFIPLVLFELANLEGQVLVAEIFNAVPEGLRANQQVTRHLITGGVAHVFTRQPIILFSEPPCQEVEITPRSYALK
jgi:hypothetical protein